MISGDNTEGTVAGKQGALEVWRGRSSSASVWGHFPGQEQALGPHGSATTWRTTRRRHYCLRWGGGLVPEGNSSLWGGETLLGSAVGGALFWGVSEALASGFSEPGSPTPLAFCRGLPGLLDGGSAGFQPGEAARLSSCFCPAALSLPEGRGSAERFCVPARTTPSSTSTHPHTTRIHGAGGGAPRKHRPLSG